MPEEWHAEKVLILATFYSGEMREGEEELQPFRDIGNLTVDRIPTLTGNRRSTG